MPFMQNPHKWHFSFGTFRKKLYLCSRKPALGMSAHHRQREADILKRRLLALCSDL